MKLDKVWLGLSLSSLLVASSIGYAGTNVITPLTLYGYVGTMPAGQYFFQPNKSGTVVSSFTTCSNVANEASQPALLNGFVSSMLIPKTGWFNYGNKVWSINESSCIDSAVYLSGTTTLGSITKYENYGYTKLADCNLTFPDNTGGDGMTIPVGSHYAIHMQMDLVNKKCSATIDPGG